MSELEAFEVGLKVMALLEQYEYVTLSDGYVEVADSLGIGPVLVASGTNLLDALGKLEDHNA